MEKLTQVTLDGSGIREGSIFYYNGSYWRYISPGSLGQVLTMGASIPEWQTGGGGGVTSVTGTASRITSTGGATPVIDISASYDALWQPVDADLTAIAALGFASTSFLKKTAVNTWALDTNTYLTTVGTGVANEIAYWPTTSTIGSLATATYPSLTELSYVKGVTSAIQTQLGTKAATTYVDALEHCWGAGTGSVVATGATNYFNAGIAITLTEASTRLPYGFTGTLIGVIIYLGTAQPGTGSFVFTHRHNGASSALTFTIPAGSAAGIYSYLVGSQAFTASDYYNMMCTNNAASNSGRINGIIYITRVS